MSIGHWCPRVIPWVRQHLDGTYKRMGNRIPISRHAWDWRGDKVMSRTQTDFTEAYAQTVGTDCELDLWRNDMVLAQDKLTCFGNYLCQIIFKSHHGGWSYVLNTRCLCTNVSVNCDLYLWPSGMGLTLSCRDADFCCIIFKSHQFSNKIMGRTRFWNAET